MQRRRFGLYLLGTGAAAKLAQAAPAVAAPEAPANLPSLLNAELGANAAPGWRHQTLPKVARSNRYELALDEEGHKALRVSSAASASTLLARVDVDAQRLPWLRWRWKVAHSLPGSDLRNKAGDDYAARLYVFFDLPLQSLGLADRMRIQMALGLAGVDVPTAALCYVWGHAQAVGSSAWNPYTDRVRMIVVDSGDEFARQWRSVSRNLAQDWAQAFGGPMPRVNGVAIGADTDNTGASVESWFGEAQFFELGA